MPTVAMAVVKAAARVSINPLNNAMQSVVGQVMVLRAADSTH
jgi:hypothetical protein